MCSVVITYVYHALVNTLSAPVICINISMIFYTHAEHSPTKTIYMKYYTQKQTCTTYTYTHTHTHTHSCTHACTHTYTHTHTHTHTYVLSLIHI